jgi:hypothetical protein
MLCNPVTLEAVRLGMGGEIGRIGQRLCDVAAFDDGHEVKKRIAGHARYMGLLAPIA